MLISLFASCSRRNDVIELQKFEIDEIDPRTKWAIVVEPYVASRAEASYEAEVKKSLRKGEIYRIDGFCTVKSGDSKENSSEIWYFVDGGWVPETSLGVYSNRLRAQESLKQK